MIDIYQTAKNYIFKPLTGLVLIAGISGCPSLEGTDEIDREIAGENVKLDALMKRAELKLEEELQSEIEELKSRKKTYSDAFAMLDDVNKRRAIVDDAVEEHNRLYRCVGEILNKKEAAYDGRLPTRKNPGSVESGCLYAVEFNSSGNITMYMGLTRDRDKDLITVEACLEMIGRESKHLNQEMAEIKKTLDHVGHVIRGK